MREELRVSRQSTTILIKSLDEEIERLREALRDIIPYIDTCNAEHREAQDKARSALQQKEDE